MYIMLCCLYGSETLYLVCKECTLQVYENAKENI
jgi:hypothetical protein